MNRTKIINLFLLLALVLSCSTACGKMTNPPSKSTGENTPSYSDQVPNTGPNVPNNNPNVPNAPNQQDKIRPDQFISIASDFSGEPIGYSDGLLFVTLDPLSDSLHCIDKEGNLVFSLPETEAFRYRPISGFHGEYAVLHEYDKATLKLTVVLCNREGNLIRAEDIGAAEFLMEEKDYFREMFADGYLIAKKTTTSFKGSVDELAVLNSKLEIVLDYSEALATNYQAFKNYTSNIHYRSGYLFCEYRYLDLKTGTYSDDTSSLYNKIVPQNQSDYWAYWSDKGVLYDQRESDYLGTFYPTPILDLRAILGDTLYRVGAFYNCEAGVLFKVDDSSQGRRYYFSMIDETGALKYDPIEVDDVWAESKNGVYVFLSDTDNADSYHIEVYNSTGKIAETDWTLSNRPRIIISDDVIHVYGIDSCKLFTTSLEPLF